MDWVDSRFLHVWYMIDSVDSTGKTSGIVTPVDLCLNCLHDRYNQ